MGERASVLLVEDDPDQAHLTTLMVARGSAFEVTLVVPDLASALRAVKEIQPQCLLLDLTLPDAIGLDSLRDLQESYPGPIVVLSGDDDSDVAVEAVRRGAQDYLVKDNVDADRLDRTLRYAVERWADKERMKELSRAKDQFLAVVSHELRTPLTPLVGFTKLLSERELLESERAEILALITEQADQLQAIIDDLLVAARTDIGGIHVNVQSVDLVQVARRCVRTYGDADRVRLSPHEPSVAVTGDPMRVSQIARNLLTNALRYGGPNVMVRVWTTGEHGVLDVTDDGDGVPPEDVERVFRPYERLHESLRHPGSIGLGLPIASHLAGLMNGTVEYEREVDRSVFRLRLPVSTTGARKISLEGALDVSVLSGDSQGAPDSRQ